MDQVVSTPRLVEAIAGTDEDHAFQGLLETVQDPVVGDAELGVRSHFRPSVVQFVTGADRFDD